jgi:hypothetical protein
MLAEALREFSSVLLTEEINRREQRDAMLLERSRTLLQLFADGMATDRARKLAKEICAAIDNREQT